MQFASMEQHYNYMSECNFGCTHPPDKPMCADNYVDCTDFGGYDPYDPCKQTCLKQETKRDVQVCQDQCIDSMTQISFISIEA